MRRPSESYFVNPILRWLFAHGWEEPVGPLGPEGVGVVDRLGPQPEPWRQAAAQLVQAVQARDLARAIEGSQGERAVRSAELAIDAILDEWCGTPTGRHPWPWPGPPPWVWQIVSEISLSAHALQAGSLRDGLLDVAAAAMQKATQAA